MTESNKIQAKKELTKLEKLSKALKQNLSRRKNVTHVIVEKTKNDLGR